MTTQKHVDGGRTSVDDLNEFVREDRVHRKLYTDPSIFLEEMTKIFGGQSWVYLAHESQLPEPNSFLTVHMGLRPVIVTRDRRGGLNAVFNRCSHRAATVCREESGVAKSFQCPYHGWTFRNTGELVGTPWPRGYSDSFDQSKHGLLRVTRVESYRGFIFGTMNDAAPSVPEWLGPATKWLDYWIDRAPNGEIFVHSGAHRMGYRGNWKLAFDNAGDGYHPAFSHRSLLEMASRMGESNDISYFKNSPDDGEMRTYALGNGHSAIDQRPSFDGPGSFWSNQRPQPGREWVEEKIRAEHGDDADRLLDLAIGSQINLSIFPNLLIIGNQIQVIEPMAVDRTQLTWHATTVGGVPPEVNAVRMRTQEDFPSFGEPDDQANFEEAQRGLAAPEAEWILMNRGYGVDGWQEPGDDGVPSSPVTDEMHVRNYFATWLRTMNSEDSR